MLSSYKVGTAADAVRFYLNGSNIKRCKRKLGFFLAPSRSCLPFLSNLGNGLQTETDNAVSFIVQLSTKIKTIRDNGQQFKTGIILWCAASIQLSKLWHLEVSLLKQEAQRKDFKTKILKKSQKWGLSYKCWKIFLVNVFKKDIDK